jgi:hypothetical protein
LLSGLSLQSAGCPADLPSGALRRNPSDNHEKKSRTWLMAVFPRTFSGILLVKSCRKSGGVDRMEKVRIVLLCVQV